LSGCTVFTVDIGYYVRKCLATVRSSLGEGFDHLCDFKSIGVSMHPVLGWVVALRPSPGQEGRGAVSVDVRPVVLAQRAEGRGVVLSASLGFAPDADRLDAQTTLDAISGDERVVGVLPAWPGTYYVTGSVNGVPFSLGVHVNPDSKGVVELLLKTYIGWLGSPETGKLKDKLAKPREHDLNPAGDPNPS
jgi:hypothetical protein